MAKAKSQLSANPSPATPNVSEANPAIPSTSTGAAGCSPDSSPDVTRTRPSPPDKVDNTSSNNISISSITEDEDDANVRDDDDGSSAFESSSDSECENEQIKKAIERIPNTLQPGSQLVRLPSAETAAMATAIQERPNIGSIAVQNSSDITFGNKTYIKGQVVIKNIYHDRKASSNGGGVVNEGYRETDGEAGIPSQKKKGTSQGETRYRGEYKNVEEVAKTVEASMYQSVIISIRCLVRKHVERIFFENLMLYINGLIKTIINWLKARLSTSNLVKDSEPSGNSTANALLDVVKALNRRLLKYVPSRGSTKPNQPVPITQENIMKSLLIISSRCQKIFNIFDTHLRNQRTPFPKKTIGKFLKTKNGQALNWDDYIRYIGLVLEKNPALKTHVGKIHSECMKYATNLPVLIELLRESKSIKP